MHFICPSAGGPGYAQRIWDTGVYRIQQPHAHSLNVLIHLRNALVGFLLLSYINTTKTRAISITSEPGVFVCGKQICRQRTNKLWQQLWRQQQRNCKTHCTLNWNQCEIQRSPPWTLWKPLNPLKLFRNSWYPAGNWFFSVVLFLARAFCGWQLTQCSSCGNGNGRTLVSEEFGRKGVKIPAPDAAPCSSANWFSGQTTHCLS